MIKDKLHTITDEDAEQVSKLLLESTQGNLYNLKFIKINRIKYDVRDGVDSEESVDVHFQATVKDDVYRKSGWKDKQYMVKLIENDRYHDYPYFCGFYIDNDNTEKVPVWKSEFLANQVEAIEFLQNKKLI